MSRRKKVYAAARRSKAAVTVHPDGTKPSFVEFMRSSPLAGIRLQIRRSRSPTRATRL